MNRWNIPLEVELEVAARDIECAYCRSPFSSIGGSYKSRPSWEHVVNDLALVSADNIVLCCVACNSSKGARSIRAWLLSSYCELRNITAESVSPVVRAVLLGDAFGHKGGA
jgi:hypothetical protein